MTNLFHISSLYYIRKHISILHIEIIQKISKRWFLARFRHLCKAKSATWKELYKKALSVPPSVCPSVHNAFLDSITLKPEVRLNSKWCQIVGTNEYYIIRKIDRDIYPISRYRGSKTTISVYAVGLSFIYFFTYKPQGSSRSGMRHITVKSDLAEGSWLTGS